MKAEREAMMLVRAELCDRLESLQRFSGRRSGRDFIASVSSIRELAAAYGLTPVARLAEALARAAAENQWRSGGGFPARLYLERLHDAIGCRRTDEPASQALLASVAIRTGA